MTKVIRHAIADLAPAQFCLKDEGELIGRTVTGRAMRGAGDYRAGVFAELLEGDRGLLGVVDMVDRSGVALGAEALDLVEGKLGAVRR